MVIEKAYGAGWGGGLVDCQKCYKLCYEVVITRVYVYTHTHNGH